MKSRLIIFRVDASMAMGTGHVMRALTLASLLHEEGAQVEFVCREHSGNLIGLIRERGFQVFSLPAGDIEFLPEDINVPDHPAWLGVDWRVDAEQTGEALAGRRVDWLIVDHYGLSVAWERAMRHCCQHLMVIDDLANREHDCDILLNQNLGRAVGDYAALLPAACVALVGPHYALLRPDFRLWHLRDCPAGSASRVLISMGGVDTGNLTEKILHCLASISVCQNLLVTVVMGRQAPHLRSIQSLASTLPFSTSVLINVEDMAGLMASCDIAIGGAGVTAWERCCVGLPSLIVIQAENQRSGALALASAGAAIVLEPQLFAGQFDETLRRMLVPEYLALMRQACFTITDGQGASRVVSEMEAFHA